MSAQKKKEPEKKAPEEPEKKKAPEEPSEEKPDPKLTKEELENLELKQRLESAKERAEVLEKLSIENEQIKKDLVEMEKKELLADLVAKGQMNVEFAQTWGKEQDLETLKRYQDTAPVIPQNHPGGKIPEDPAPEDDDQTKWISSDTRESGGSIGGLRRSEALQNRLPYMLYQGRQ